MNKTDDFHDRIEIANRLKAIRTAKSISQDEMAKKIGIAYITYVKLENAGHNITIKNLKKISRILNVTTDMIVSGETGVEHIGFEEYIKYATMFSPEKLKVLKDNIELIQKLQAQN